MRAGFEPFVEYLAACTGEQIEFFPVADYAAVVMGMKYDRVQIGRFGCRGYIEAAEKAGAIAIARGVREVGGTASSYHSLIIARRDRHITDLNGVSFVFVDPLSTSGYLAPALYIQEEGIELGETMYAGGHPQSVMAVQSGTVDAGACSETFYNTALAEGQITEEEIEIIWRSDPMPFGPISVSAGVKPAVREKLQRCLVAAPQDLVEGLHINLVAFETATDSDYDGIRQMEKLR